MRKLVSVFIALIMCVPAGAPAEFLVGTDIAAEEICDFIYTWSASTASPFLQRYRFYTEDGIKLFRHETREGGGWPQTEEDITVSGTKELSEADWAAFLACVSGGRVFTPTDDLLDGDPGPWMYLYRPGDGDRGLEFTFASVEKRFSFERLCSDLARDHVLTRFYISRGGYMAPRSCEITLQNGGYYLHENEDAPRIMDPVSAAGLREIIQTYDVESWDGFCGSDPYVLDGEGFMLEMEFADGASVRAAGENAFPDRYFDVMAGIDGILEKEQMARLAGTYRYEGEGFGGDFTVTLNADGTYSFYEGPLSSYLGSGTWNVFFNAVYLEEDEEAGFALKFMFGIEDGALVYVAMGSDPFVYVKVSDGERFVRQDGSF